MFAGEAAVLLHALDWEVAQAKRSAYASGTGHNFHSQWKASLLFYCFCGVCPLPTSVENLCRYIMFLAANMNVYQTIKNYLNGVHVLHACHGLSFGLRDHFEVQLVLQAVKRRLRQAPFAKIPITPDILKAFYHRFDLASPFYASLWCSYIFAFFGFLRKSNVVPRSLASFDCLKHLTQDSITITPSGLLLTLNWSKSIQFKERVVTVPLCSIPGNILDLVNAVSCMCRLSPAGPRPPPFLISMVTAIWIKLLITRSLKLLAYHMFTRELLQGLTALGIDPSQYGGHSFRCGGCTFAFRAGVAAELLKAPGPGIACVICYLDFSPAQRLSVTKSMATALQ